LKPTPLRRGCRDLCRRLLAQSIRGSHRQSRSSLRLLRLLPRKLVRDVRAQSLRVVRILHLLRPDVSRR
jgi:hypothetical protein